MLWRWLQIRNSKFNDVKFWHKVLNNIPLLIILMINLEFDSKHQILSFLSFFTCFLKSFHENPNNFQSALHITNDNFWYSHNNISFNQIWSYPVEEVTLLTSSIQQISYFAISVVPTAQLYCYTILQFSLVAGLEQLGYELQQKACILRFTDQPVLLQNYNFYFLASSLPNNNTVQL